MTRARYFGPDIALRGKTALVRQHPFDPNSLLVQFDDASSMRDRGWHLFDTKDFVIESEDF